MNNLKKDELKNILKKNKIKFNTNLKKDELMKLIKKNKIKIGGQTGNQNNLNQENNTKGQSPVSVTNNQIREYKNQRQLNDKMKEKRSKWTLGSMGNWTKSMIPGTTTISRKLRDIRRLKDVETLASFIPRDPVEYAGGNKFYFSKNLWRNLKRNMLILASVPSEKLEEILLTTINGKTDFSNLKDMVSRSGLLSSDPTKSRIQIEPQIFLPNSNTAQNLRGGKKNNKKNKKN